jgi:hypothetical protein
MITAFGKTYETTAEATARIAVLHSLNETWGASDDRVTEINALREGIAIWEAAQAEGMTDEAPAEEQGDVWTVEKNEYSVPCEHPLCEQLHQRFMTTHTFRGLVSAGGVYVEREITQRFHDRTVNEWVVLLNGKREGAAGEFDTFETKREAVAALRSRGLL